MSAASRRAVSMNRGATVDAHRLAVGTHHPRDTLGGIAEAAADVEYPLSGLRRDESQRHLTVGAQPGGHDRAKSLEALVQRPVPRVDRLGIWAQSRTGCGGQCHRPPPPGDTRGGLADVHAGPYSIFRGWASPTPAAATLTMERR